MHILNKDNVEQWYFIKTRIMKGVTILNLVTSVMCAQYVMINDKHLIE